MTFNETNIQRDIIGRFSEKQGSAPELSLGGPYEPEVVIPLSVNWTEPNVIPPRARKPRSVQRTLDVEVTVPIVGEDEAPVAISFEGDQFTPGEYRVYNGELYVKNNRVDADGIKSLFEDNYDGARSHEESESAVAIDMQRRANGLLVMGDEVWSKADEPVYAVMTFGMGGNHGSTSLSINSVSRYLREGRPVGESVFPLDQREAAIEYALGRAEERGDTQSFERIKDAPIVQLSDDFKPGSTFAPAPRISYRSAYDLGWDATPEQVEEGFAEFKQQILTIPGATRDVPDGWGGMTKRVDLSKLTESQESDYLEYVKRVEGFPRR